MRKYVENQGEQISEDAEPEEIAAQVQDLREEEIQDTQDALNENLELLKKEAPNKANYNAVSQSIENTYSVYKEHRNAKQCHQRDG